MMKRSSSGCTKSADLRPPLGRVIVGGLIFSQMITLFVTPVIYLWLEWFQEHVLGKVPFLHRAHMHDEGEPRPQPVNAMARFNPRQLRQSKRSVIMLHTGSRSTTEV
jgi:hypothetical protein